MSSSGNCRRARLRSLYLAMAATTLALTASALPARSEADSCRGGERRVQLLATILNTRNRNYDCLGVSLDGRADIIGLRFEAHDVEGASGAGPVRVREFALRELASERGAVLDGVPGHDAVILRGEIAAGANTAALVVRFLHNGFTGEFRDCRVVLARDRDASWHLLDAANRPVPLVVVKTWELPLVGTVGIETLEGACAN